MPFTEEKSFLAARSIQAFLEALPAGERAIEQEAEQAWAGNLLAVAFVALGVCFVGFCLLGVVDTGKRVLGRQRRATGGGRKPASHVV